MIWLLVSNLSRAAEDLSWFYQLITANGMLSLNCV